MEKYELKKYRLKTLEGEALLQRIARNVAWYAIRLSLHRHLVNGYPSSTLLFINIKDKEKAAEHIRWMELAQGQALDIEYDDEIDYSKAQPLRHVIFRG
ncbi:hypothetical protein K2814_000080 [Escherichia coli]|nr:hypothetical protein [Escherichia coli]